MVVVVIQKSFKNVLTSRFALLVGCVHTQSSHWNSNHGDGRRGG